MAIIKDLRAESKIDSELEIVELHLNNKVFDSETESIFISYFRFLNRRKSYLLVK